MLRILLLRWAAIAIAIAIAAALLPSVDIKGGFFGLIGVALIFGLVNALIGPILRLLSLPLTVITFGLFSLIVNGVLLAITAGIADNLDVGGFFSVVLAALVISLLTTILAVLVPDTSGGSDGVGSPGDGLRRASRRLLRRPRRDQRTDLAAGARRRVDRHGSV